MTTEENRASALAAITSVLRQQLEVDDYLDVGRGTAKLLGVSEMKLVNALAVLQAEGYKVHTVRLAQQGTDTVTIVKFLAKPGTTWKDAWEFARTQSLPKIQDSSIERAI